MHHGRRMRKSAGFSRMARSANFSRKADGAGPQVVIRAYEVETVTAAGQHRYVVAIDINAPQHN